MKSLIQNEYFAVKKFLQVTFEHFFIEMILQFLIDVSSLKATDILYSLLLKLFPFWEYKYFHSHLQG